MTHVRVRYPVQGGHVHTQFFSVHTKHPNFVLRDSTHGKNGDLVFTVEEWEDVKAALGAHHDLFEPEER